MYLNTSHHNNSIDSTPPHSIRSNPDSATSLVSKSQEHHTYRYKWYQQLNTSQIHPSLGKPPIPQTFQKPQILTAQCQPYHTKPQRPPLWENRTIISSTGCTSILKLIISTLNKPYHNKCRRIFSSLPLQG